MELRYDNYYNNYNIDWHSLGLGKTPEYPDPRTAKCRGATLDGRNPCEYVKPPRMNCDDGCPTGFKPCAMKMVGPLPCGVWCAQIPKCTPKAHEKHNRNYTTKVKVLPRLVVFYVLITINLLLGEKSMLMIVVHLCMSSESSHDVNRTSPSCRS